MTPFKVFTCFLEFIGSVSIGVVRFTVLREVVFGSNVCVGFCCVKFWSHESAQADFVIMGTLGKRGVALQPIGVTVLNDQGELGGHVWKLLPSTKSRGQQ